MSTFTNGTTLYTVTLRFSNSYADHDRPSRWDWVSLLGEPDAQCISVGSEPNPGWGSPCEDCEGGRHEDCMGQGYDCVCTYCKEGE